MPTFVKKIIAPGVYETGTGPGRRRVNVDAAKIDRWVDNTNRLIKSGYRIPSPWMHDDKVGPINLLQHPEGFPADRNAGYWTNFYRDADHNLYGVLETDSDKVGKEVQEVSLYALDKYRDGEGQEHEDVLFHVACVTHPAVKNQSNFAPVNGSYAISLSSAVMVEPSDNAGPGNLSQLKQLLGKLGIHLAPDTTTENLWDRLASAAHALVARDEAEESPPPDASTHNFSSQGVPIMFSNAKPQEIVDALAKLGAINAKTGKPYTLTDLPQEQPAPANAPAAPPVSFSAPAAPPAPPAPAPNPAEAFARKAVIDGYHKRTSALIQRGVISKEVAEQYVSPHLETLDVKFNEKGELLPTPLDPLLAGWEAFQGSPAAATAFANAPAPTPVNKPKGWFNGDETPGEIPEHQQGTDDDVVFKEFLANTGLFA